MMEIALRDYKNRIVRIQLCYKAKKDSLIWREKTFANDIWDAEVAALVKYFERKKKNRLLKWKHKKVDIMQKIINIDKEVKDRILELYMVRQKFYYTIRFFYWLYEFRGENFTEKQLEEFQDTIRVRSG
jgi:hypothetical protein